MYKLILSRHPFEERVYNAFILEESPQLENADLEIYRKLFTPLLRSKDGAIRPERRPRIAALFKIAWVKNKLIAEANEFAKKINCITAHKDTCQLIRKKKFTQKIGQNRERETKKRPGEELSSILMEQNGSIFGNDEQKISEVDMEITNNLIAEYKQKSKTVRLLLK